jgi:hypothetical protein
VTALQSISKKDKHAILDKGIVLCRDLQAELLREIGFRDPKISRVLKEAEDLVGKTVVSH